MPFFGVLIEGSGFEIPADDGSTARGFLVWRYVGAGSPDEAVRRVIAELETLPRLESARNNMRLNVDTVLEVQELPSKQPGFIFYESP